MEALKAKYQGKRCWIVGNGPSLAHTPLDELQWEYCFGLNKISMIFERTAWRPSFLVSTTTDLQDSNYRAEVERGIQSSYRGFVDGTAWPENKRLPENAYRLNCSQSEALKAADGQDDFWSDDPTERVSKFGSTILPAFQLAAWMGFTHIYLVGCDLGYRSFGDGGDLNHFTADYYPTGAIEDGENAAMIRAHEIAAVNCKRLGVEIYNATIGGELEVHSRIDFQQVLNDR